MNAKDIDGLTVFMRACFNGKVELVKLLLKHSEIDFNVKGKFGWTGLMFACFHGRTDVVKQLLNHDPDLTLPKESDIQWYSEEVQSMIEEKTKEKERKKRKKEKKERQKLKKLNTKS